MTSPIQGYQFGTNMIFGTTSTPPLFMSETDNKTSKVAKESMDESEAPATGQYEVNCCCIHCTGCPACVTIFILCFWNPCCWPVFLCDPCCRDG